jgi:predicted permease
MLPASFSNDVAIAARSFRRAPGLLLAAVSTLALGIGSSTALFSVINAVLVRPLPYARPESRVQIWSRWVGFDKTWVSAAEVWDYRRLASFRQVAAWSTDHANLTGDGDPVRVGIARVTANTFSTLGAEPMLGRSFRTEEQLEGADNVVVLGHRLWRSRYGEDASVVGRSILLDGVPRVVVGVMPPRFRLPTDFGEDAADPTELWVPFFVPDDPQQRGSHSYYAAAELAPGVTAAQANAELRSLARDNLREGLYPESMRFEPFAVPLRDEIVGSLRPTLMLLSGAVGFLLAIACANVAHLLLARAEVRQREVAVRCSLGAGRGRLLAQLLVESLVLAIPGGLLGLGLAVGGVRALLASGLAGLPRAAEATLDGRVLLFALAVSLGTTLVFGLAPALRLLRVNLSEALRDGSRGLTAGRGRHRLRGLLVVAETALSVVLLVGASLLLQSLWALQRVDLGFVPEGALTARLSVPETSYPEPEKVVAFYREVLERARAIPGVKAAGLVRLLPLGAPIGDWGLEVEGFENTRERQAKGDWQVVSDGGLGALGERLLRGRDFTAADTADTQPVALVNETLARTYWPGRDPLGRRIRQGGPDRRWAVVVGLVADVRHNGLTVPIKEKFYRPHAQFHTSTGFAPRTMTMVLRTDGDPARLAAPLRAVVRAADPSVPVAALHPLSEVVAGALATPRLAGTVLALFAVLALVLSAVGLFGVLDYVVSQRTSEIGVRLALGAGPAEVRRLVLGSGLRLSTMGAVIGCLGALALTRLIASLLHDVHPRDPLTFALVPALLLLVAALASFLPARRAMRVDPVAALRSE